MTIPFNVRCVRRSLTCTARGKNHGWEHRPFHEGHLELPRGRFHSWSFLTESTAMSVLTESGKDKCLTGRCSSCSQTCVPAELENLYLERKMPSICRRSVSALLTAQLSAYFVFCG